MDKKLIEKFDLFPDLVGYASKRLNNDDFVNVVLFFQEKEIDNWKQLELHKEAVNRAADYYNQVDIFRGILPHGVGSKSTITNTATTATNAALEDCSVAFSLQNKFQLDFAARDSSSSEKHTHNT